LRRPKESSFGLHLFLASKYHLISNSGSKPIDAFARAVESECRFNRGLSFLHRQELSYLFFV